MKTLFIEARFARDIVISDGVLQKLPQRVGIFSSVQFIGWVDKVAAQLERLGKKAVIFQPANTRHKGQLLGCSITRFEGADCFLYIGDGMFHPLAIAVSNPEPVHHLNPYTGKLGTISPQERQNAARKRRAALAKMLMSDNIGILVSTKPGQQNLKLAMSLRKKLRSKEKSGFILLDNNLSREHLDSFNFIDCYINTACPRIGIDDPDALGKKILAYQDIGDALD